MYAAGSPATEEMEEDHLSLVVQDQPGQHSQTSQKKFKNFFCVTYKVVGMNALRQSLRVEECLLSLPGKRASPLLVPQLIIDSQKTRNQDFCEHTDYFVSFTSAL